MQCSEVGKGGVVSISIYLRVDRLLQYHVMSYIVATHRHMRSSRAQVGSDSLPLVHLDYHDTGVTTKRDRRFNIESSVSVVVVVTRAKEREAAWHGIRSSPAGPSPSRY
jgi:hypothetical protein